MLTFKYEDNIESLKKELASLICYNIKGLTQEIAGKKLGVFQPEISKLKNEKYRHFSIEKLLSFLFRIGYTIDIDIKKGM